MNKKYVYKPYNELFSKLFLEEKRRLLNILKEECFDVKHIGSTAIPGLGGKGIIDIGITVAKENFDSSFHNIRKRPDVIDQSFAWVQEQIVEWEKTHGSE